MAHCYYLPLVAEVLPLSDSLLLQHCRLGRLQHAVQAPQDCEGEDDLAGVALLVVAAQEVGDGPDKGREVSVGQGSSTLPPKLYV